MKRTWRTNPGQTGIWGATYNSGRPGFGIGLAITPSGWALSGSLFGRGALVGWAAKEPESWPVADTYREVEVQFNRR